MFILIVGGSWIFKIGVRTTEGKGKVWEMKSVIIHILDKERENK